MMQAHSYTGRIAPGLPFITYLPPKPGTRPCGGYRETEKPVPSSPKEQHPQHGSKPTGLIEPTDSILG